MHARHFAASLLALVSHAATATPSAALAARPESGFGAPLVCSPGALASVHSVATKSPGFNPSDADGAWVVDWMGKAGYPARLPIHETARAAALRAATLLHRGNIIAAKMANDEAVKSVPGYKSQPFAASFESFLTVLTQPVLHASYPSSVRAAGEKWPADADHAQTHGVDMETASASLLEIIRRAAMSMAALGKTYELPAVRYYVLANGFRDSIALSAARAGVCGLRLNPETVKKLDVSARFMAMPAAVVDEESKK